MATPQTSEEPPRPRRRPFVVAALLLALAAIVGVALVGFTLLRVRPDLDAGKRALQEGRTALVNGRLGTAEKAFATAKDRFASASSHAGSGLGRVATWVPFLGNDVDVAAALATAGGHLADAGVGVTKAVNGLSGGLDALTPTDGALPLDAFAQVAPALASARTDADAALSAISDAPSAFLVGPIGQARWDAQQQAEEAATVFGAGADLAAGLPAFAGANGTARYLVVAQNPAEQRGTGGLWGAYTILTFRDGRPSFSGTAPTESLPAVLPDQIPAPNPDYRANYDQFGGAASWPNMNMTPDFPSAARAALGNYEQGSGTKLDGVIAVDPFALEDMLALTGSVDIPGTDVKIDAGNVVAVSTNTAYRLFQDSKERKAVLGTVATDVFGRFLSMRGRGTGRLKALGSAAADGHLLVYSTDPVFERGLTTAGVAGAFPPGPGEDVAAVIVNNGGGNKVDYYATRTIDYSVQLGGAGEAHEQMTVTIHNAAPDHGVPAYVIGPNSRLPGAKAGDQVSFIGVWCHAPCTLTGSARDGVPIGVANGSELGVPWFRDYRTIASGTTGRFSVSWQTSDAWHGDSSAGGYRLLFPGQTTVKPTRAHVTIEAPAGTRITWTSEPMTVDGGTATWNGTPGPRTVLEVRFSAPVPLRWWRDLSNALG
ncbi:MAG: DUF4012 domain-containing protein [Actinomycetota bacterium]